ncbi:MAG: NosD domain-containing protein [Candidatus Hodarchaeota archaeon]
MRKLKKLSFVTLLVLVLANWSAPQIRQTKSQGHSLMRFDLLSNDSVEHIYDWHPIQSQVGVSDRSSFIPQANYTSHPPILISSNDDFVTLGFPGTGSASNPYHIDKLNISGAFNFPAIKIANTTAHFCISNCFIRILNNRSWEDCTESGTVNEGVCNLDGIRLINVANGIIENCTLDFTRLTLGWRDSGANGILLAACQDCLIDYNYITNFDSPIRVNGGGRNVTIENNFCTRGIHLDITSYVEVINNSCRFIDLRGASTCVIKKNCCVNTQELDENEGFIYSGIEISKGWDYFFERLAPGDHNVIEQNFCSGFSAGIGLSGEHCSNNILTNNTCSNNIYGIRISGDCHYNIVRKNWLEENSGYGVYLAPGSKWIFGGWMSEPVYPSYNQIFCNVFLNRNPDTTPQASDPGGLNGVEYNYWSDWSDHPDSDNDGFIDDSYPLDGGLLFLKISDTHPLVNTSLAYSLTIDSVAIPQTYFFLRSLQKNFLLILVVSLSFLAAAIVIFRKIRTRWD